MGLMLRHGTVLTGCLVSGGLTAVLRLESGWVENREVHVTADHTTLVYKHYPPQPQRAETAGGAQNALRLRASFSGSIRSWSCLVVAASPQAAGMRM